MFSRGIPVFKTITEQNVLLRKMCSGPGQGQSQHWPGWEGRGGMGLELLLFPSTDRLLSFESLLEQNSFVLMILSRSYSSVLSSPLHREGAVLKMLFCFTFVSFPNG